MSGFHRSGHNYIVTSRQDWLGITKSKNVFSLQIIHKTFHKVDKKFFCNSYLLTD